MNTDMVKLFDHNDKLVSNFDNEIEKILISIHGENYYDVDEELVNTNLISVEEVKKEEIKEEIKEETKKLEKKPSKIMEFIPVLFFIILFVILIVAGYYFLNTIDLGNMLK